LENPRTRLGGDERNNSNRATILCIEWNADESREVVLWTYHKVAENYAWAMDILKLYHA
jgi:hypothetical protein